MAALSGLLGMPLNHRQELVAKWGFALFIASFEVVQVAKYVANLIKARR